MTVYMGNPMYPYESLKNKKKTVPVFPPCMQKEQAQAGGTSGGDPSASAEEAQYRVFFRELESYLTTEFYTGETAANFLAHW